MTDAEKMAEEYAKYNTIFEDEFSNDKRAFLAGYAAGEKAGAESRQAEVDRLEEMIQDLADSSANQIEKLHQKTYDIDDLYKEALTKLQAAEAKLKLACEVINEMQNRIKPWMSANSSSLSDALNEAFNIGAKFNSDNLELFIAYLDKIRGARG